MKCLRCDNPDMRWVKTKLSTWKENRFLRTTIIHTPVYLLLSCDVCYYCTWVNSTDVALVFGLEKDICPFPDCQGASKNDEIGVCEEHFTDLFVNQVGGLP